ncbi:MAG: HD domain-containing phosphohydrolase, partial [Candidatus Eremiobacterota bacterium]
ILDLIFKLKSSAGGKSQVEHCKETAILAKEMCDILCPYLSQDIQMAAYLHEVGKISLDEAIVRKHRKGEALTEEETAKIKEYPGHSIKIISSIESMKDEIDFIKYMEEDNYSLMPIGAQILKVANDYQEMVHFDYLGLSSEEAFMRIEDKSGTVYNPDIVATLGKILEKIKNKNIKTQLLYMEIINQALDSKDAYTGKHSRDTTRIALAIGKKMELNKNDLNDLEIAATLHDIGKIKVPDNILNAPRKLEPWEFEIIKKHPVDSAIFFDDLPGFERIALLIRHHHEKYDGTGYPDGLKGEDIPFLSRILAVADVFSALTTERVYRIDEKGQKKAFTKEMALEIMENMKGHFDPYILEAFKQVAEEL